MHIALLGKSGRITADQTENHYSQTMVFVCDTVNMGVVYPFVGTAFKADPVKYGAYRYNG